VSIAAITEAQWVAGALALVLAGLLFATGSARVRFLIAWCLLSILPFTLWTAPIAPARYLYLATLPFSILLACGAAAGLAYILRSRAWSLASRWGATAALAGVALGAIVALFYVGARATIDRNEAFARTAEPYRALAYDLPHVLPYVASNSRLVIYYGVWEGSFVWQDAVVQTIYRDPTLRTVNVDWAATESSGPAPRPNDVVVYFTEHGFIAPAPRR
jgi:hypothetical protein